MNHTTHTLESDSTEREHFRAIQRHSNAVGHYRRVVEKLTGGLLSWAGRKRLERKAKALLVSTIPQQV